MPVTSQPATSREIADHFMALPDHHGNWGTSMDNSKWYVNDNTYINGVMLTVDMDYMMGYLIEVVDRHPNRVTFHTITTYYGGGDHSIDTYAHECGTFFDRTPEADPLTVSLWAVTRIDQRVKAHETAQRRVRE